jgi:hypothetical protein
MNAREMSRHYFRQTISTHDAAELYSLARIYAADLTNTEHTADTAADLSDVAQEIERRTR